jgi:hypothetical protein
MRILLITAFTFSPLLAIANECHCQPNSCFVKDDDGETSVSGEPINLFAKRGARKECPRAMGVVRLP